MMDDGGNYFGYSNQELELSDGVPVGKTLDNEDYSITDQVVRSASRDRLLSRQSYSQNQVVQGQNKSIVLNDGKTDRLIIGYSKEAF